MNTSSLIRRLLLSALFLCVFPFASLAQGEIFVANQVRSHHIHPGDHARSRDDSILRDRQKIFAGDPSPFDAFGLSVSVSDGTLVVGQPGIGGTGAARVFERSGEDRSGEWQESKAIEFVGDQREVQFGKSVSLSGNLLAASDDLYRNERTNDLQGAVFIFDRDEGGIDNWGLMATLFPEGNDELNFGRAVALSGRTLVTTSATNDRSITFVYVFEKGPEAESEWVRMAKIEFNFHPGALPVGMAISGSNLAIGSRSDDGEYVVSLYERNRGGASAWGHVKKIVPDSSINPSSRFGEALSFSGDALAVGAPGDSVVPGSNSGLVYIFERNNGGLNFWGQDSVISAEDGVDFDSFGMALSLDQDALLVASPFNDDFGNNAGAVYVFQRGDGGASWEQKLKFAASDVEADDRFGRLQSFSNGTFVVGSPTDSDFGDDAGAVYTFSIQFEDGGDSCSVVQARNGRVAVICL